MWISIFQRILSGIACGGIVTFGALTILMIIDFTPDITLLWTYMLLSFVIGIYFALASLIFEIENWSPLKKTTIHFTLSVIVFYTVALPAGWVPLEPIAILLSVGIFIIVYIIFWASFSMYCKKVETSLNNSLKNK